MGPLGKATTPNHGPEDLMADLVASGVKLGSCSGTSFSLPYSGIYNKL